jgi:thioredoxin 1
MYNKTMKNLKEITEAEFTNEVTNSTIPVVVDFWAPWCGPCKMMAPVLDQIANEYAGKVKFVKVNVDEAQKIAASHSVNSVPTLIVVKNGEAVAQQVGFSGPKAFKQWLEQALK